MLVLILAIIQGPLAGYFFYSRYNPRTRIFEMSYCSIWPMCTARSDLVKKEWEILKSLSKCIFLRAPSSGRTVEANCRDAVNDDSVVRKAVPYGSRDHEREKTVGKNIEARWPCVTIDLPFKFCEVLTWLFFQWLKRGGSGRSCRHTNYNCCCCLDGVKRKSISRVL